MKKRSRKILIALAAVIVCCAVASPFVLRAMLLRGRFAGRIKKTVEEQVTKSVGDPLKLGRVDIDLWGRVRIEGLELGRAGRELIRGGTVTVSLDWRQFFKNSSDPVKVVKSIVVTAPDIHIVRGKDGMWNYPRPAAKKKKGPVYPRLDIRLENAKVTLDDYFATASLYFRHIEADGIEGGLRLAPSGNVDIKISTKKNSLCGSLDAEMKFNGARGWVVDGRCDGLRADAARTIISRWHIDLGGAPQTVDIHASAKYNGVGKYPDYGYTFRSKLKGASLRFSDYDIDVSDASGEFEFANGLLSVTGVSAAFAGGRVSGDVSFEPGAARRVTARLELDGVRAAEAGKWVKSRIGEKMRGVFTGWAYVDGPPEDLAVKAEVEAEKFYNGTYSADIARAGIEYRQRRLKIGYLEFTDGGSSARLSGGVSYTEDWKMGAYSIAARFERYEPRKLVRLLGAETTLAMRGELSGDILAEKTSVGGRPDVSGTLVAESFGVAPLRGEGPGTVSFSMRNGNIDIESLIYEGGGLSAVAAGNIAPDGKMDIVIEGAQADAPVVMALLGRGDIKSRGAVRISGRLGGTVSAPVLYGTLEAAKLAVSELDIESLEGGFEYSADSMKLNGLKVRSDGGDHTVSGVIATGKKGKVSLEIAVNGADVKKLVAALHEVAGTPEPDISDLAGKVFATVKIEGGAEAPMYDISGRVEGLQAYGEKFDRVSADVLLNGDNATITGGRLTSGESSMKFSGAVTGGRLDVGISARRFGLDGLAVAAKYEVRGIVDVSGRLAGTTKSPSLTAIVSSPKFKLRGMDLKVEPVTLVYSDDTVRIQNITLHRAMETYVATGTYDLAASGLDLYVSVTDASPGTVAELFGVTLPEGTTGLISGDAHLRSVAGELAGAVDMTATQLAVAKYPLTSASLKGNFGHGVMDVEEFRASNDVSEFTGRGRIDLEDPRRSMLKIDAGRVDLGMLSALGMVPYPMKGLADVNIDVGTDRDKPYMYGSLYVYDIEVSGITFDQARGSFEFAGDLLTLTQLQLIRDKQRLLVRGDVPITAGGEKNVDNRFQLLFSTKNFDLATLNPMLSKHGFTVAGAAEVESFIMRGSVGRPALEGSISVRDASVKHDDIGAPVVKINGSVTASANALSLDNLTGVLNNRSISVSGGVFFKGLVPDRYEFTLEDVNNLYVEYKKQYRGMIDLKGIKITGDMEGMSLTSAAGRNANVTLHDGIYTIPEAVPAPQAASATYKYEIPDRELLVTAGRSFTVRSAGDKLNINPSGTLRIRGDIMNPEIKGYLTTSRGYLWLSALNIWFKLNDEAVIGFYSIDPLGVVPFFNASAQAHKGGLVIEMKVSGPMVNLQQLPEYQKMCGIDSGPGVRGSANVSTPVTVASVQIGENNVSICPSLKLTAVDKNGNTLTEDALLRKITPVESLEMGQDLSAIAKSQFSDLFTSYGSSIIEKYSRIDNFDLSLDPNRDIFIQLEKCLGQKYCLRYERLFAQQEKEQFDALYKFRKKSYLLWGIDQDGQSTYEVEYRMSF